MYFCNRKFVLFRAYTTEYSKFSTILLLTSIFNCVIIILIIEKIRQEEFQKSCKKAIRSHIVKSGETIFSFIPITTRFLCQPTRSPNCITTTAVKSGFVNAETGYGSQVTTFMPYLPATWSSVLPEFPIIPAAVRLSNTPNADAISSILMKPVCLKSAGFLPKNSLMGTESSLPLF